MMDLQIQRSKNSMTLRLLSQVRDPNSRIQFQNNSGSIHVVANQRQTELWKSTCFEAFLKVPGTTDYFELNFSPSGAWNSYIFEGYRNPDPPQEFQSISFVKNDIQIKELSFSFEVQVNAETAESKNLSPTESDLLKELFSAPRLEIGLTTVVLFNDGQKKYFALKHVSDKPDFHQFDSFIIHR